MRRTYPHSFARYAFSRYAVSYLTFLTLTLLFAGPTIWAADTATPPDPDAEGLTGDARVQALVERVQHEQAAMRTLEASFEQHKESLLLLEPEVSKGTFSYRAPDQVIWEFISPNQTVVVIDGEDMLTWYRDLERAERMNVGQQAERIFEYLGAGNSLQRLRRYFELSVAFPDDPEKPYRLDLQPRFARVAKRVQSMEIHIDRQRFIPTYLQFVEADGDITEMRFLDMRLNVELPEDRFTPDLPEGIEVHTIDLEGRAGP